MAFSAYLLQMDRCFSLILLFGIYAEKIFLFNFTKIGKLQKKKRRSFWKSGMLVLIFDRGQRLAFFRLLHNFSRGKAAGSGIAAFLLQLSY